MTAHDERALRLARRLVDAHLGGEDSPDAALEALVAHLYPETRDELVELVVEVAP